MEYLFNLYIFYGDFFIFAGMILFSFVFKNNYPGQKFFNLLFLICYVIFFISAYPDKTCFEIQGACNSDDFLPSINIIPVLIILLILPANFVLIIFDLLRHKKEHLNFIKQVIFYIGIIFLFIGVAILYIGFKYFN